MSRSLLVRELNKIPFSDLVVGGFGVVTITYYLKHSLLLKYYKSYTELLGNDGPVSPSAQLKNMVNTVEQDIKHLANENTSIDPFIVPGLRTIHAGTIGTLNGGVIGLPAYFEFNYIEDVDDKIKVSDSLYNEKPMEELYDCFLLSDKAKKYGIAYEILCVNTRQVYLETFMPLGIGYAIGLASTYVPTLLNIHPTGRVLLYSLILATGLSLWRSLHTVVKNYFEGEVLESLATLGSEYIEGGIEFYSKALERRSLKLEWKNQNTRNFNICSEKINSVTSRKEIPMNYRLAFYKSKLSKDATNDNENQKIEEPIN